MLPRSFSRKQRITDFANASSQFSGFTKDGFTYPSPYNLSRGRPEPRSATFLRHSIGNNAFILVQEYLPVVHRLRLAASP